MLQDHYPCSRNIDNLFNNMKIDILLEILKKGKKQLS